MHLLVAVLGLDEVGKGLGLGNLLGVVSVAVVVAVVLGSNVFHLVDAAALRASLQRTLLGKLRIVTSTVSIFRAEPICVMQFLTYAEPDNDVGVGGIASATSKLLIAGGAHQDGALHGSFAAGVEGSHVENVNALHLSEDFQTLKTGGLLEIGRDGARLATRSDEVVLGLYLYRR